MTTSVVEEFDVLIVGAGVSGIGFACRLRQLCPDKTFCVLEKRTSPGGTWDYLDFPGIRSDTDMWMYAYPFQPWEHEQSMASKSLILDYLQKTIDGHGVKPCIRYKEEAVAAVWQSDLARWKVETSKGKLYSCQFIMQASGYFEFDDGYVPSFKGSENFNGEIVHTHKLTQDESRYVGRNVAVIGSGATAVTLVPFMAASAQHLTMVQRSPSHIVGIPSDTCVLRPLKPYLSTGLFYNINRWVRVARNAAVVTLCEKCPELMGKHILKENITKLNNDESLRKHFTPRYNVWDERVCLTNDDTLFEGINAGRITMVTGDIDRFVEDGILMQDGTRINADLVVCATGMNLQQNMPFSTMKVSIDGEEVRGPSRLIYKGCMLSGVPNFLFSFGYLKAGAWTQKSDLTAMFGCRLIKYMTSKGLASCCPLRDESMVEQPMHSFSSGYIKRAEANGGLPKVGATSPWDRPENYFKDTWRYLYAPVDEKSLQFHQATPPSRL